MTYEMNPTEYVRHLRERALDWKARGHAKVGQVLFRYANQLEAQIREPNLAISLPLDT